MVRNLSIRLWGGASRDDTKNGCVADYVRAGLHMNASFVTYHVNESCQCRSSSCRICQTCSAMQIVQIVPAINTSTTQFVFGQERSLFPHPKTRNINQGKSKEVNLSATKKPGQKPTVSREDRKKRREIRRLHMNNSLSQLIRKCKLRF